MLFCCFLIFFKINFFRKNSFRNTISVSNSFDPDQARHHVGPDLGPKLFAKVISDLTSMKNIKHSEMKALESNSKEHLQNQANIKLQYKINFLRRLTMPCKIFT